MKTRTEAYEKADAVNSIINRNCEPLVDNIRKIDKLEIVNYLAYLRTIQTNLFILQTIAEEELKSRTTLGELIRKGKI